MKSLFYSLLIGMAIVWGALYALSENSIQRDIFPNRHDSTFVHNDFYMPRSCLESTNHYAATEVTPLKDCCYPVLALELYRPFPATKVGCMSFIVLSVVVFVVGLFIFIRETETEWGQIILTMFGILSTCLVVRTTERGNPIFIAAAAVYVFLAWYASPVRWKRWFAAVSLAVASVLKIAPVLFGLLYLLAPGKEDEERSTYDWQSMTICFVCGATLFFIPFFIDGNGFTDIHQWISNSMLNSKAYTNFWGLPFIWGISGAIRRLVPLSQDMCRLITLLAGIVSLSVLFVPKGKFGICLSLADKLFFIVVSILFIVKNSQYYMGLYFIPALVLWLKEALEKNWPVVRRWSTLTQFVLWLLLLMPIQFPLGNGTGNGFLTASAFLLIVGIRFSLIFRRH